jgi:WD40 repeat protein/serine/threonine protein kinase
MPLAQLYRRAHNAKTAQELCNNAYFLWEAGLKLLSSTAIVEYAGRGGADPELTECLRNLARPALGHWWEFARRLTPVLADQGLAPFIAIRDLLLGRARDDLPRAAGLDAVLREVLEGKVGARATVYLAELFDRLVRYRNDEIGHGAAGQRPTGFYERVGRSLVAGATEVFARLDVLAGHRLVFTADVRQTEGIWLVERSQLVGEVAQRIPPLELPRGEAARVPDGNRVFLDDPVVAASDATSLRLLHPLLIYSPETNEVSFLNARRGERTTEYLCYTTGCHNRRPDLGTEQRALMARVLGMAVTAEDAAQWATRSQAEEPAPIPMPASSRLLGEYELITELGRGGMGVVYRAWQPSLHRQVAIKRLLQIGDPRAETRFRREIHALGQVEHPNLVKIFADGKDGEAWFYVMELVEGATLAAVCDKLTANKSSAGSLDFNTWQAALSTVCEESRQAEQPLSDNGAIAQSPPPVSAEQPVTPSCVPSLAAPSYVRHIVELIRQVAQAAHELHEAGIIHRDIKPSNIIVTADGTQAVLMDLGLAQLTDEVQGRLTRTRQFVGTLRYASPQQVLAVSRLDRRSDVYSLGATLWELLTLCPIYGADDQMPTPDLMERIQRDEPTRLRTHNPGIAKDLEAIVLKCLEKSSDRRYATAGELVTDLKRFLGGEPVQARPVSGWERGMKWARRHPTSAALTVVSALAAFAIVGGLVSLAYGTRLATALKDLQNERVRTELQQIETNKQRDEAERQRLARVQEQRSITSRLQYAAQLNWAEHEWQSSNVLKVITLLDGLRPTQSDQTDLRGFEWYYLRQLCRSGERLIRPQAGPVRSVAYSPDGRSLAAIVGDLLQSELRVWSLSKGSEIPDFRSPNHFERVTSIAYSPVGGHVAIANGRNLDLLDAETATKIRSFRPSYGILDLANVTITNVAFSPDGTHLASTGTDRALRIWDTRTGTQILKIDHQPEGIFLRLAFSPDGKRIATVAETETVVRVWNATTGLPEQTIWGHTDGILGVVFSPDGNTIASAGGDKTIRLWNTRTGKNVRTIRGHIDMVTSVAFSPDGERLASASGDLANPQKPGEVKVWDTKTGRQLYSLKGHTASVWSVCFSPDGKRLATASWDETVKVWNLATAAGSRILAKHEAPVHGVAFRPDGQRLASVGDDRTLKVWDVATGTEVFSILAHDDLISTVSFSPDGERLATGGRDKKVKIWDATSGKHLRTLVGHDDRVTSVVFSPDKGSIASASVDKTVRIWNVTTGDELLRIDQHHGSVRDVAFSPDAHYIASACEDKVVRLWNAAAGRLSSAFTGHTDYAYRVAFSPDGHRLVSASEDGTVKVWDIGSGQVVFSLLRHTGSVYCATFNPDGQRIVSAGEDMMIKLSDALTGQELITLPGHTGPVLCLAISRDSKYLASGSEDKTVRIWDGAPQP